jgi:hypothetical protein
MIAAAVMAAVLLVGTGGARHGTAGDGSDVPPRWVDQYTTFGCAPGGGDPVFADRVQPDQTKRLNQVIADCPEDLWGGIVMSRQARVDVTQAQLEMLANRAAGEGDSDDEQSDPAAGPSGVDGANPSVDEQGPILVQAVSVSSAGTNLLLMGWLPALLVLVLAVDVVVGRRRARSSGEPAVPASDRGHEENVPFP